LGLTVLVAGLFVLVPILGTLGAAVAVLLSTVVRVAFIVCCLPAVLTLRPMACFGEELLSRRFPYGGRLR
jgi:hypothetical protein